MVNQHPYIEEEQTLQWTKEKVQHDKQRSTKHTHDRCTMVNAINCIILFLEYKWANKLN